MKNISKLSQIVLLIIPAFALLSSCNQETKKELPEIETPIVNVSDYGVVTWNNVENAKSYVVLINDTQVADTIYYSYDINETGLGRYKINVFARTGSKDYKDSSLSPDIYYTISTVQLETPHLVFNGANIVWNSIENADKYDVYVDGIIDDNAKVEKDGNKEKLSLPMKKGGTFSIEVRAINNNGQYRSSKLSNKQDFVAQDINQSWKEDGISDNWTETNSYYIQHIGSDILVWNDVIGTSPAYFEDYVNISNKYKSFAIYGFRPESFESANIVVEMRKYNGEYFTLTSDGRDEVLAKETKLGQYFWQLPDDFTEGNYFVRVKIQSSGNYQSQYVIRAFSFEETSTYVAPSVDVNIPVSFTSVTLETKALYNTNRGYLTYALDSSTVLDASFKIIPDEYMGEGYYRIQEPNGMYLALSRMYREDTVVADFTIATPYNQIALDQIWFFKPIASIAGENIFTILNYGFTDGVDPKTGLTRYCVLAAPLLGVDNFGTWHDEQHTDLQFVIKKEDVTFNPSGKFIPSKEIDLSKKVLASFTGTNAVFTMKDGWLQIGSLIPETINLDPYVWTFEDAQDGYCYIKLENGEYLYAVNDIGGWYHIASGSKDDNTSKYLWKIVSRGGIFYYIGNKYVNQNTGNEAYIVRDTDNRVTFYLDYFNKADQILRFKNL